LNSKQTIKYVLIPLVLLFLIFTTVINITFDHETKTQIPESKLVTNKPKSCYDNDCYLINYDSLRVLCFPKENSFKSFFACGENKECRINVFIRENGLFIVNDTNVAVIENNFFGFTKILVKEGEHSGKECYVDRLYIVK
jgi:hypothetical protein